MRWIHVALLFTLASACRTPTGDKATGNDVEDDTPIVTDPDAVKDSDGDGYNADEDCNDEDDAVNPGATEVVYDGVDNDCNPVTLDDDLDQDGFVLADDCNDDDAEMNPGLPEVCDDKDNDCNELIDDATGDVWYVDSDGDGYGDPEQDVLSCTGEGALSAEPTDCDDVNELVNPAATELCNNIDDDCDTEVDEEAEDAPPWYTDADLDGFGDPATEVFSCVQPEGTVASAEDCDDTLAEVRPSAQEICDGIDNNCDTVIDTDAVDLITWFQDNDADSYGDDAVTVQACVVPTGYAAVGGDCDDARGEDNPGAPEVCDTFDNNCDGQVDEAAATDAAIWHRDLDQDGFGDTTITLSSCDQPTGYVTDSTDCNDTIPTIFPGAEELCDGFDNDCDTEIDEGATQEATWYEDADGDGFGNDAVTQQACFQPAGYTASPGDCDESQVTTYPGAPELCDGLDNDCDTDVDEDGAVDGQTWYLDFDGDGFGGSLVSQVSCAQPVGFADNPDDCDDGNSLTSPGAEEICDGEDNDCDSSIDEDAVDLQTFWIDVDGDGFGDASASVDSCTLPPGYSINDEDCDDQSALVRPNGVEICNSIDDDCNGSIDDNAANPLTFYGDTDGDGFGSFVSGTTLACVAPDGFADADDDCDDANSGVYPGADEICDTVDNDCDSDIDEDALDAAVWYEDGDSDGFGNANVPLAQCDQPAGFVESSDDCVDNDGNIFPGATEQCDGLDNDCNGLVDDDAAGASTWYADTDGDGFGDAADSIEACTQPAGYVLDDADCDDSEASINPSRSEVCDSIDNDCNGLVDDGALGAPDWFADVDGDGFGDSATSINQCDAPAGFVADASDCDDTNLAVNPNADEVCDNVDNDCDGGVDIGASDATAWYVDGDTDGFGAGAPSLACTAPAGSVSSSDDCDDGNAAVNPGADEICDTLDNDCDLLVDEEGATGSSEYFADLDGDGFGDAANTISACSVPNGYVSDSTDCDDLAPATYPGATEVCDGLDNDCDSDVDEGVTQNATWYFDGDNDGFGDDAITQDACIAPTGYVAVGGDCDDSAANVFPGEVEFCDNIDNNCDGVIDEDGAQDAPTWYFDFDADGFGSNVLTFDSCVAPAGFVGNDDDCDDGEEDTNPDAEELCDGEDNDCDGDVDEDAVDVASWYVDLDSDGFGDIADVQEACDQPVGYVDNPSDCDDTQSTVRPGGVELCNGLDDDCDSIVDNGAINPVTWYEDADGDTYGIAASTVQSCDQPTGFASRPGDCDDTSGTVSPGADELCDSVDNDCDSVVDESDALDAVSWYADGDADGFGNPNVPTQACAQPSGFVGNDTDCNDANAVISPAGTEVCDGLDNDCDGSVDNGASDTVNWFRDVDGDGFGDASDSTTSCSQPSGYVLNSDDCNDTSAISNPSQVEICDGLDNDCDGPADEEAIDGSFWWADADGDGFGDIGSVVRECSQPSGYVDNTADCNDGSAAINPSQAEVCDSIDNDCSGSADDGAVDAVTFHRDADGDGFGNVNIPTTTCNQPTGFVVDSSDCNDSSAQVFPGATEICDGLDNDCDSAVDDGATGANLWYADVDGDFFGDDSDVQQSCSQPSGYVLASGDCDDGEFAINPLATEVCDGEDNDCDGSADVGAVDATDWYRDDDSDGFGDANIMLIACDQPADFVDVDGDCDDGEPLANPDETEVCDAIDNDCDGDVDLDVPGAPVFYRDGDGDGFGDASISQAACSAPVGYVSNSTDCLDALDTVFPGATELCDGLDNDCNSAIDDNVAGNATWYLDSDGDGFGNIGISQQSCSQPSGYVLDDRDCNDGQAAINPGATEFCDSIDNNCDGSVDNDAVDATSFYADGDGDGFGAGAATFACSAPSGFVATATDCDDGAASVNPNATEVCDSADNDCNGLVDDNAQGAPTWYRDADSDGFGNAAFSRDECTAPAGFVATAGDCLDSNASVSPAGTEVCDGLDNNCSGAVDEGATDAATWYQDSDADGFGNPGATQDACSQPAGFVSDDRDCNDGAAAINPSAVEVCDSVDNNCDSVTDTDAIDRLDWFVDNDGDGFGDASGGSACTVPSNGSLVTGDCDDSSSVTYPGAPEICDLEDNDCDSTIDGPNPVGASTWFLDFDVDGFAGGDLSVEACDAPLNYYDTDTDCDDGIASVYPGAPELCDGLDNDCDSTVDEDVLDALTFYIDNDGDGFGGGTGSIEACVNPGGFIGTGGDCDDGNIAINPGADELCNSIDDDCDGQTDENSAINASTWYLDADGDTYGDPAVTQVACNQPSSYLANNEDCDDLSDQNFPGAPERCDGADNDCDGIFDENDAVDAVLWFEDNDFDGFGQTASTVRECYQPTGYAAQSNDCNDTLATINPNAIEQCDSIDNDCDGTVDEDDAIDADLWFEDSDLDGFGDPESTRFACSQPSGYVGDDSDCDDSAVDINPLGTEVCNGLDDDCNSLGDDGSVCPCIVEHEIGTGRPYMFCTSGRRWTSARNYCSSFGYHLLSVVDSTEDFFTQGYADTYAPTQKWWIGLNDRATEGTFVWDNGEPVDYENWYPGEPNNVGNEDCTQFNRFSTPEWNDEPCSRSFRFICEFE